MTLLIKNDVYAFLIRLDLMFSMLLWKAYINITKFVISYIKSLSLY